MLNFRHLGDRDMGAGRGRDQHPAQGLQVVAEVALVADVDRIALQSLDRLGDVHAADRRLDDVLHIADRQPVAGGGLAVDGVVEVVAADHPFGIGAQGSRDGAHHRLDLVRRAGSEWSGRRP